MTAPEWLVPCKACNTGRPNDGGPCPWCGLHLVLDPVYVDASQRDGVAGLAVVGALGEFTRRVSTNSSAAAERWALEWAFSIAHSRGRRNLVFRSDCLDVVRQFAHGKPTWCWVVEHVPRDLNRHAHSLSVRARRPPLPPVPRWAPADRTAA